MKEEIIKNLSGIIEYVKQGADFVKEQAPLYIQEMINYGIWTSVFEVIVFSICTILSVYGLLKFIKWLKKEEECYEDHIVEFVVAGVIIFLFALLVFNCVEELIKAVAAPRVYVVEKLLSLGK